MSELRFTIDDIFTKGREVAVMGTVVGEPIAVGHSLVLSGDKGEHEVTVTAIDIFRGSLEVATTADGEVALTLGGVTRADVNKGDKLLSNS